MDKRASIGVKKADFKFAAYLPALPADGAGANPHFATLTITSSFISQLLQLRSLCLLNDLWRVDVVASPDSWGTDPHLFRIDMPTLTVQGREFWFRDMPMELANAIETYPFRIDQLEYLYSEREKEGDGSAAFLADDPIKLFETVHKLCARAGKQSGTPPEAEFHLH